MQRNEVSLVVFATLATFFYCGAFYGWGPLQLLLEQNGNFHGRCDSSVVDDNIVCEAQTSALLNVRMISQLTVLGSPVLGLLVDRRGPTPLAALMTLFAIVGLSTMSVAVAFPGKVDFLLYVSVICLGFTASTGTQLTVQSGLVFVDSNRRRCNRVISGLNAVYDAGAVTFLGMWAGSQWIEGITLLTLVLAYLVLALLFLGGYTVSFWLVTKSAQLESEVDIEMLKRDESNKATEPTMELTTRTHGMELDRAHFEESTKTVELMGTMSPDLESSDVESMEMNCSTNEIDPLSAPNAASNRESMKELTGASGDDSSRFSGGDAYVAIAQRPVPQQLRSQAYVTLCIFYGFHVTANVWALTTARDFLKYLGDDEHDNRYLTIFTLLTPVSLLALPFVDIAMHRYGYHPALQSVNALGLAHGLVKVISSSLDVQILGFVFSSFFGCFLYSSSLSCLASFMSKDAMGRGMGIFHVMAGLFSLINIPLATLAVERFEGNFLIPNLVFLVLLIPMSYCTWLTGQSLQRNREHLSQ